MIRKYLGYFSLLMILTLLTACMSSTRTMEDKIMVTVSILPEKYFVERIGGEHVAVNVMVGPGESPHSYEPKAEQMTALSYSALYFSIGVEFEKAWLGKIAAANPEMLIVDLSKDIQKIPISAHSHQDEPEEEHEGGTLDPHIWLSTKNAKLFAESITLSLVEVDKDHQTEYQRNLTSFLEDIKSLEDQIQATFSGIQTKRFFVFHPAWGYFAKDFGLEQVAIEINGSEPSAQELARIIDEAKEEGVQVIFAQPEFSSRTADYIAQEINGEVILISPLEENWLENMKKVADTFSKALKKDHE